MPQQSGFKRRDLWRVQVYFSKSHFLVHYNRLHRNAIDCCMLTYNVKKKIDVLIFWVLVTRIEQFP